MTKILCPTRGGEASYRTQDAAIARAQEQGAELVFLYVVDTHFLDRRSRAVRADVVMGEMTRMGEFLLAMAQERAAAQGVQAGVCIRHGKFRQELELAVQEEEAGLVILGQPAGKESTFKLGSLETFAAELGEETGAEVEVV